MASSRATESLASRRAPSQRRAAFHVRRTGSVAPLDRAGARSLDGTYVFITSGEAPSDREVRTLRALARDGLALVWIDRLEHCGTDAAVVLRFDDAHAAGRRQPIRGAPLDLALAPPSRIHFDESFGGFLIDRAVAGSNQSDARVRVHLEGEQSGFLDLGTSGINPWSASIRYFYQSKTPPFALQRIVYPIFTENGGETARFHPLGGAITATPRSSAPLTYTSNFRTPLGDSISLEMTSTSGFAYQYDPIDDAAYQVLTGEWTVGLPGATAAPASIDVLCGLSGTEWLRIEAGGALSFQPGAPAFAPYFGATGTTNMTALAATGATGVAQSITTTWIAPVAGR